jgi:hemolysin III
MPDSNLQLGRRVAHAYSDFPNYTAAESAADRIIHLVGLAAAAAAIGWLLVHIVHRATINQLVADLIYCLGLVGMLAASAIYNLVGPSRLKAMLRRVDHAMIFVMIAGSYTPFTMGVLRPQLGVPLCVLVWGLAASGIALSLLCPYRDERVSLGLYLGMGWLVLSILRPLVAVLPGGVLLLLLVGGLIYSLGAFVHARARLPFHNALWHAMVVVAAALHFAAVAQLSFGPR